MLLMSNHNSRIHNQIHKINNNIKLMLNQDLRQIYKTPNKAIKNILKRVQINKYKIKINHQIIILNLKLIKKLRK